MIYLDYLTLTSYERRPITIMPKILYGIWPGDWKSAKVMQYKGWRNGPIFYGFADQDGRRHLMLTVSGRVAHEIFGALSFDITSHMTATRIDLQVTVPLPFGWNENDIWNRVCEGVGKTKIVNDSEKTWTVYVGSRRSRIFWRIYIKHYEKTYLRYEVELKRHHAHAVFTALSKYGDAALKSLYLTRLKKLKVADKAKEPALELVLGMGGKDLSYELEKEEREESIKKMCQWLDNLTIGFERRMGDHEVGHVMRNYIDQWAEMKDVLDGSGGGPGFE